MIRRRTVVGGIMLAVLFVVLGWRASIAWEQYQGVVACERVFEEAHELLHKQADVDAAVARFEKCLAMNPLYYPAYEILVHIYEERSDRTRARATIERGVKALGEEPRIQRLAGVYYLNCEKKPARAAEFLEVALRAAPDDRVCQALLRQARKDAP